MLDWSKEELSTKKRLCVHWSSLLIDHAHVINVFAFLVLNAFAPILSIFPPPKVKYVLCQDKLNAEAESQSERRESGERIALTSLWSNYYQLISIDLSMKCAIEFCLQRWTFLMKVTNYGRWIFAFPFCSIDTMPNYLGPYCPYNSSSKWNGMKRMKSSHAFTLANHIGGARTATAHLSITILICHYYQHFHFEAFQGFIADECRPPTKVTKDQQI